MVQIFRKVSDISLHLRVAPCLISLMLLISVKQSYSYKVTVGILVVYALLIHCRANIFEFITMNLICGIAHANCILL